MGALKDNKKNDHTRYITFRVTPEQASQLEREAESRGCNTSQLIRHKLFRRQPSSAQSDALGRIDSALKEAVEEFRSLNDFCEQNKGDCDLKSVMEEAKAGLKHVEACLNSSVLAPDQMFVYPYPELKRGVMRATIVEKARTEKTAKGFMYLSLQIALHVPNGKKEQYRVVTRCTMPPRCLRKGAEIAIWGYIKKEKDREIYADAIRLLPDTKKD